MTVFFVTVPELMEGSMAFQTLLSIAPISGFYFDRGRQGKQSCLFISTQRSYSKISAMVQAR
jgi:hypothetical protein